MAGEFTLVENNGYGNVCLWKCNSCGTDIRSTMKPRGHLCQRGSVSPLNQGPQQLSFQTPGLPSPFLNPQSYTPPYVPFTPHIPPPVIRQPPVFPQSTASTISPQLLQWQMELERREQQRFDKWQEAQDRQREDLIKYQQETLDKVLKTFENVNKDKEKPESVVKTNCPKWGKDESLKRFINNLTLWNKIQKHKGKYLHLIGALAESERKMEKERIEMAVQNKQLNPEDEDIIDKIVLKLEEWFGKPRLDLATVSWRTINSMRRRPGEDVGSYINRFEAAYADLKCSASDLPEDILTIILLDGLNLDMNQRQNIVAKIQFEDNPSLFEDAKKAIKILMGPVVSNPEINSSEEINYHNNKAHHYNERGRSKSRHRSNSKSRKSSKSSERKKSSSDRSNGRERNRGWERKSSYENEDIRICYRSESNSQDILFANDNVHRMILDCGATKLLRASFR